MLPNGDKPVSTWNNRDEAWKDVAKGIREVCEKLIKEHDKKILEESGAEVRSEDKSERSPENESLIVNLGEKLSERFDPHDKPILFLRARIDFSHEAGSTWVMRVLVNDEILRDERLINKPPAKRIKDGRVVPWFSVQNESWRLCYSLNFKDNYYHPRYRVVNGDPYIFMFDLSGIETRNGEFEVIIEHTGQEEIEAHENPIIVRGIEIL